ncbi:hypothetical protein GCM10010972_15300 [Cellulomonas carbonis]|nr:hypothetical protein [Cellulomonas carbonis]GGC03177.1 hypothetical protein GCM10010972_15300 [Cellulomonas carbonis]
MAGRDEVEQALLDSIQELARDAATAMNRGSEVPKHSAEAALALAQTWEIVRVRKPGRAAVV